MGGEWLVKEGEEYDQAHSRWTNECDASTRLQKRVTKERLEFWIGEEQEFGGRGVCFVRGGLDLWDAEIWP